MEISPELIDKLARLSRLSFVDETEKEKIRNDLNKILEFVEQLNEVDTEGVEPLIFINEDTNVLREDEVKHEITRVDALKNAPVKNEEYFFVPKVIKKAT